MKTNKDKRLEIRLPEEELEQIQNNAKACGKTVSAYLREVGCNMCVLNIDYSCVGEHTDELSSIKNAIHQVVYTIKKTGSYTPVDIEYIVKRVNEVMESENNFLNKHSLFVQKSENLIERTVRKIVNKKLSQK